jgi:SAM-dependent methyltransferase
VRQDLYRGSAAYYPVGRLPYPPELAGALPLAPSRRVLDVGCGPGSLTLLMAPRVGGVVGIDADADMLAEAARQAERAGIANVEWRHLRAEELPAGLGRFDLVTFAQSFHWMDQRAVAAAVRAMLSPGGALVLVGATTHRGDDSDDPLPHPRPPHERIAELVRSYLGDPGRAGRPWTDDVMRDAGFADQVRIEVGAGGVVTRTADEVVAAIFSLSSATPHLLGDDRARFEADLRELLHGTSPGGEFAERRRDITLEVWR